MRISHGFPTPLGATVTRDGINFAVFSRHATSVILELYTAPNDRKAAQSLTLDPDRHRTGDVWHVFCHGLAEGQLYGYRVDGPYAPELGHRFNVNKLLSDPYARSLTGTYRHDDAAFGFDPKSPDKDLSFGPLDSAPSTVRSVAVSYSRYNWGNDRRPKIPVERMVIYEAHVGGFTKHPSSGVAHPGTYPGLMEKIPYLKELGITTLELLPIHHFDANEPLFINVANGRRNTNYWGYSSLGFFAPHAGYAASKKPGAEVDEFRDLVAACHEAGIEVVLDVVYNHTGEGGRLGPTYSLRGFDNSIYYHLERGREYRNYSGCGNTLACHHPVVKQLILDSLRYWALYMHVDGFRFDLATILGRGKDGEWINDYSLVDEIVHDPVLRDVKLIAEPWDAAGMYLVGRFPEGWTEWNDRFRDDSRRFIRGDLGHAADLARRISGSVDLFGGRRGSRGTLNFVTCHDGFTLRDLVSYKNKHNESNGEENRDGTSENFSANYGHEGDSQDPGIDELRVRQAKNLLIALFSARGVPMLLAGDEFWRTQRGNNNAYCHDNELSWIDWSPSSRRNEMQRFVRLLIKLRRDHPAFQRPFSSDPFTPTAKDRAKEIPPDLIWHGVELKKADWGYHSQALAFQILGCPKGMEGTEWADSDILVILNAWMQPLTYQLPILPRPFLWHRIVDTSIATPGDIVEEVHAEPIEDPMYHAVPRSAVILVARQA